MAHIVLPCCVCCGACEPECPTGAISRRGSQYQINTGVCVDCKGYHRSPVCVMVCPADAIVPEGTPYHSKFPGTKTY